MKSILNSIPLYVMQMTLVPFGVCNKIEGLLR